MEVYINRNRSLYRLRYGIKKQTIPQKRKKTIAEIVSAPYYSRYFILVLKFNIVNTCLIKPKHYLCVDKMIFNSMNADIEKARNYIKQGEINLANKLLSDLLSRSTDTKEKAEAYYLLGNLYRKQSDWKLALDNYQLSIDLNPEGPAKSAQKMVQEIMNFFHTDMYNH